MKNGKTLSRPQILLSNPFLDREQNNLLRPELSPALMRQTSRLSAVGTRKSEARRPELDI